MGITTQLSNGPTTVEKTNHHAVLTERRTDHDPRRGRLVQLRCTNDARPGMGERFLLQERRSGSRAEMANVDGPSVDWPRRHDVALEKSRDEATDARPRLVVGIRVTDHGHAKRCVQAGTVGRERRVLRWYGFVDC